MDGGLERVASLYKVRHRETDPKCVKNTDEIFVVVNIHCIILQSQCAQEELPTCEITGTVTFQASNKQNRFL